MKEIGLFYAMNAAKTSHMQRKYVRSSDTKK